MIVFFFIVISSLNSKKRKDLFILEIKIKGLQNKAKDTFLFLEFMNK